jgi:hypothetical protein
MRHHLTSLHTSIWDVVEIGVQVPSPGDEDCWGPSVSEGPQKHDLTMFLKYINRYLRTRIRATV